MNLKPNDRSSSANRCGIILSGGNGTRLRDLVYRRRGDHLPKQYLNFIGERSMLEHTWRRAEKLLPAEKLFTVIAKEHLLFDEVRRQIASRPSERVMLQPENKDTAPGLLLPLMHLYKRYPKAIVAVFPSDHFVLEEDLFMHHVEHAFRVVEADASRMVLLGLEPRGPDPEYGYIVPGERVETFPLKLARQVEMFVGTPRTEAAKRIIASGALWNTMVMVFACKTILTVVESAAPGLYHSFGPILDALGTADEQAAVEKVYQKLSPINFSTGVLEVLPFAHRQALLVLPVRGVTWSDWGSADRLSSSLRDLGAAEYDQSLNVLQDTLQVDRSHNMVSGSNGQANRLTAVKRK